MSLFQDYLKKATNEDLSLENLSDNQIEIVGNNVFGKIGGKDIGKLNVNQFYSLVKTKMPSMYKAIEAEGGIEAIKGTDGKVDITIHTDGKITIIPDKKV